MNDNCSLSRFGWRELELITEKLLPTIRRKCKQQGKCILQSPNLKE